jgi:hypothetical protein
LMVSGPAGAGTGGVSRQQPARSETKDISPQTTEPGSPAAENLPGSRRFILDTAVQLTEGNLCGIPHKATKATQNGDSGPSRSFTCQVNRDTKGILMQLAPSSFLFVAFCEFQLPFQGQTQTAGRLMILSSHDSVLPPRRHCRRGQNHGKTESFPTANDAQPAAS